MRRGGAAMAEPLACAQCGASGGRTVPGRAGRHLRRYATALRPSAPDWDGWHLLRYGLRSGGGLWPSRLLAPSAVRAAAEQCPAGQADPCAGTRLPYGRARRTGMAGTCSGTDCAAAEGYGRAACLRPVRCERRPNSAWPGRPTPAPVRDCPTAERAGLGWLALAPVRTAQRRRAMAEPPACAQCGASGGRTVPGWAGRHLRRYATALRPSAPDWAGWHLLRY